MIRIFIGYDDNESLAYHVLAHSIMRRASQPVSITPIRRSNLRSLFWRKRDKSESTDFSLSRFVVPASCDFFGHGIFMDSDMLCLTDIAELWNKRSPSAAIHCVKHDYTPSSNIKMLGAIQQPYPCKNWSSLMLMNFGRCRKLTTEYVNIAPPSELHQFKWLGNQTIKELPKEWNWLVGEYENTCLNPKIVHWTLGGPWWAQYKNAPFANLWHAELSNMMDESASAKLSSEAQNAAQRHYQAAAG